MIQAHAINETYETTGQIPRPLHVHSAQSGWNSGYLYYDPETYRPEINKALARAKRILSNNPEDFEELVQDVDFEMSKAQQYYGDRMNAALAYQIAKNQAGNFLQNRIKSQTIVDTDAEGNPVLDEFGLARGLNSAELKRQAEDPSSAHEERKKAKKLIEMYARKYPRFVSLDDKPQSDDDETEIISSTERKISRLLQERTGTDLLKAFRDRGGLPALQQLVSTWHGDKRRVGEAMLEADFTVRSVPGSIRVKSGDSLRMYGEISRGS